MGVGGVKRTLTCGADVFLHFSNHTAWRYGLALVRGYVEIRRVDRVVPILSHFVVPKTETQEALKASEGERFISTTLLRVLVDVVCAVGDKSTVEQVVRVLKDLRIDFAPVRGFVTQHYGHFASLFE